MGANLHSCRGTRIAPTRMEWAFQDQDSAIVQRRSISDSERLDVARRRIRAVVVAATELVAVAKEVRSGHQRDGHGKDHVHVKERSQ